VSNPWFRAAFDAWSLGVEASSVIALRTLKLAAGGVAASHEAHRMVAEKIQAGLALQALALTGGLGFTPQRAAVKTLAHYRTKVRANRRRLAKRRKTSTR
jgi:hypothetical protein